MSSPGPIHIEAVVDDAEHPALVAAAEQLGECLNAASENRHEVRLHFSPSLEAIAVREPATVVIASLLPEVARDEPMSSIEARWRTQLSSLPASPALSVFLCTVFRHVPRDAPQQHPDGRAATTERIRRLNLLAAELSHDTGAGIVDIDRAFAHLGARALKTDYRLSGAVAAEVAAHTIVRSMLSVGLDDAVAPEVQERALQFQGALWQIGGLLSRRLAQSR
jgi:hypothetical protein